MKRILGIALCLCMLISILPTNVFASSPVNIFNVTVTEPKAGEKPVYEASVPETASTYVTKTEWSGELDSNGCFKADTAYTVNVTVRLKPGQDKYLKYVASTTKVNKNLAEVTYISQDEQEAVITYTFASGANAGSTANANASGSTESKTIGDLSVCEEEWEVLRLCNIERANEGLESMSMIQALQEGCNIREKEISTLFSHTRPNGEQPQSVIPEEYKWGYTAENIADGQRSAQRVVTEWMYSPGHRAAIMHKEMGYMGVGFYKPTYSWVQLFAGRKDIISFTVSTDKRVFSSKEEILSEYMTLTASNGVVSYLPLDFDSMVNNNGNYTPRISADNLPVFSLTAEAIENEKNKPDTSEKFENLSVNDYEWELLRLTNVERAKEGTNSLSMPQSLQLTCDIREADLAERYSHYRPDGTMYNGILSEEMIYMYTGENIAKGETPEAAMQNLLKQTTYCGNLLRKEFGYVGIGYTDNGGRWVQIFGTRENVIKCEVSTEQRVFSSKDEIKKHYLKLTDDRGIVSYLPLDFDSMRVSDGKYIPRINSKGINLPVFSIGEAQAAETVVTPSQDTGSSGTKFTDVAADAYYASAVNWAIAKGITSGTSETTFSPDATCTKAQILTFLWRAAGSPAHEGPNNFLDVSESDYYYHAANWASSRTMVSGNKFEGNDPCTRSSTVFYLWKLAGCPKNFSSYSDKFTDVQSGTSVADYVGWAVASGITSGTSETTFSPNATCTRGQIVTFLLRAFK